MNKVVFPNSAAFGVLYDLVGMTAPGALSLRLFTNNLSPNILTAPGSAVEMAGRGYAPLVLNPSLWTSVAGQGAAAFYPEHTWTFTAGTEITVYGYYVTSASGALRWLRRFESPVTIPAPGGTISVSLVFELS